MTGECSGLKSIENSSPKSVLDWLMCLKEIVWGVNLILMGRNSVWSLSEMFGGVRPRFGPVLWLQVVNKTNTPMFMLQSCCCCFLLNIFFFLKGESIKVQFGQCKI